MSNSYEIDFENLTHTRSPFHIRGIRFVVVFVQVIHTVSECNNSTYARCQSNVGLVAQHLERVTQQSAHTDTGVAAWLIKNPSVNFRSNYNVLALLPV